jgi:hypothetical protein
MVNGETYIVSEVVVLRIQIHLFSGKFSLVLDGCPIPCILGVIFFTFTKVRIDFSARRYNFLFHPEEESEFEPIDLGNVISQKISVSQ